MDPLPAAAEPTYLTDVLTRAGVLDGARVRAVTVESARDTVLSRIVRLRLAYDGTAHRAPPSLILKTGLPGSAGEAWNSGPQEIAFYAEIGRDMPVVPRCFDGRSGGDGWHLLLEDLTDTHTIATEWPLPPTDMQAEHILEAWAAFHAAWWDDARLGSGVGAWADDAAIEEHRQYFATSFTRFADRMGDALSPDRRRLVERLLAAGSAPFPWLGSRRNVTVTHGDAHFWNAFLPGDPARHRVKLFDWDSWRLGSAAQDLAYMLAMHWYPEQRRRAEAPLLDRYHDALAAYGVVGYGRDALADDYRRSVLWQIRRPVVQAALNLPPVIWWNNFERTMLAVDDLGCRDLLA